MSDEENKKAMQDQIKELMPKIKKENDFISGEIYKRVFRELSKTNPELILELLAEIKGI